MQRIWLRAKARERWSRRGSWIIYNGFSALYESSSLLAHQLCSPDQKPTALLTRAHLIFLHQPYRSPYRSFSSEVISTRRQWRQQMLFFKNRLPLHDRQTPPSSPALASPERLLTTMHFQQFLELLRAALANQTVP